MKRHYLVYENDPWLRDYYDDIDKRYKRYQETLGFINRNFGDLKNFAYAYKYYGFNYDYKRKGTWYREWAPGAEAMFVFGDFNNWNRHSLPLVKNQFGVWEIFLHSKEYPFERLHESRVKVLVINGNYQKERIPAYIKYAVQDEQTKDFTGIILLKDEYNWKQKDWKFNLKQPLLIYEAHIGMAQDKEGIGTYKEFEENILPRVKKLGYTAIQLMGILEHPYYGSFGYHVSNFFAPSSRFGKPEELKSLIDKAHSLGLAVILDLVHSHAVKNINEGLNYFDGTDCQYFYPGERGNHPYWDSKIFDYGKTEVLRFLLSNIRYWIEEFNFDGFRFDGVGSIMYIHHGYRDYYDQNAYFREGVDENAIVYLQLANTLAHSLKENFITIAEDVTGMPGLTYPPEEGGIGFDYRLGMGIPDFWIKIIKEKPFENWDIYEIWNVLNDRKPDVKTVAYCESHDQALVGDQTIAFRLMGKEMYYYMHKSYPNLIVDNGIALHKMIRLITITLGGNAYLNFMGNEFGHPEWIDFPREGNRWSYKYARRQWHLADDPNLKYSYLLEFDYEMIDLVKKYPEIFEGYGYQLQMDVENKTIVFEKAGLIFVFNFHFSRSIPDYVCKVRKEGVYTIILNTDNKLFGGHGRINESCKFYSFSEGNNIYIKIYNTSFTAIVLKPS